MAFHGRAVEDRQHRPGGDRATGQVEQRFDVPGSDDRSVTGPPSLGRARVRHLFRRAGWQAPGAEAAIAIEVDDRLFQGRQPGPASGMEVEIAVEFDRRELTAWQRARYEAAVGVQGDVVDFDQSGAGAGGEQRRDDAAQPTPQALAAQTA